MGISDVNLFFFKFLYLFFILFYFCLFRASHVAYGGSQTRGLIGFIALAFATAMWDLSPVLDLQPQLMQFLLNLKLRTLHLTFSVTL